LKGGKTPGKKDKPRKVKSHTAALLWVGGKGNQKLRTRHQTGRSFRPKKRTGWKKKGRQKKALLKKNGMGGVSSRKKGREKWQTYRAEMIGKELGSAGTVSRSGKVMSEL